MKKVLIISYGYPPFNAPAVQRPYSLAKYLDKSKYKVTVLTCPNADSSLGVDPNFDESLPNVKLIKVNTIFGGSASGLRNSGMADSSSGIKTTIKKKLFSLLSVVIFPDKAVFWYFNVISYLKKHKELISETDVVFTTSPMITNHLIGKYIAKKNNDICWVSDFRDFHYTENLSHSSSVYSKYHKGLERSIIKNSSIVTFISFAMMDLHKKNYPKYTNKMSYIYNGFDKDEFQKLQISELSQGPLTIFYAGSFYKGLRSPLPLLSLLDKCIENEYLQLDELEIRIAGNFEQELIEEAKSFKSFSQVEFLGRIPRNDVLEILTKTHLLWLIVGNEISHHTGVPLKFYEYLAARRPIINFAPINSEPTKIIEEHHLGISFDSEGNISQRDLEEMKTLIESYKSGTLNMPLKASKIAMFTREEQAKQFETLFEQ